MDPIEYLLRVFPTDKRLRAICEEEMPGMSAKARARLRTAILTGFTSILSEESLPARPPILKMRKALEEQARSMLRSLKEAGATLEPKKSERKGRRR
jgi:hypothetical protein